MDPKAFHNFGSKDEKAVDDEDESLGLSTSGQDDEEKFKSAAPLVVTCAHCKESYCFPGIFHKLDDTDKPFIKRENGAAPNTNGDASNSSGDAASSSTTDADTKKESPSVQGLGSGSLIPVLSGLKCPNSLTSGCPGLLASAEDSGRVLTHFTNRINGEIRKQTQAYYSSYYKCNDSSCNRRTRDLSVRGNSCLATTIENFKEYPCKGKMEREVRSETRIELSKNGNTIVGRVYLTISFPMVCLVSLSSSLRLNSIYSYNTIVPCSTWSARLN